ncbi:MAG: hypothetical protein ABSF71_12660 [Terriglobia bacterium]|jgi:hypothetical protein
MASILALSAVLGLAAYWDTPAADVPQAEISNGELRARLFLPDIHNGYYRGTRFDWSGVIAAFEYQGHNYYGPWYNRIDPRVHDFQYEGAEIVASTCSGISGPVEEFTTNHSALGFDEAPVGGTFIKIGVGVLRKDSAEYDYVKQYEIVNPGQWKVEAHGDSVDFTQELTDAATGYGYIYHKIVRLVPGKPEMVLEHSLKNTGRRTIQSSVYNHNFLVLDHQAPGPDFSLTVPFQIHSPHPPDKDLAEIRGNHLVYLTSLANQDVVFAPLLGFSGSPQDNEIRIENRRVGAGMLIGGNRPLSMLNVWSIRSVLSVEPFIAMTIEPGHEFTWEMSYQYYVLAPAPK